MIEQKAYRQSKIKYNTFIILFFYVDSKKSNAKCTVSNFVVFWFKYSRLLSYQQPSLNKCDTLKQDPGPYILFCFIFNYRCIYHHAILSNLSELVSTHDVAFYCNFHSHTKLCLATAIHTLLSVKLHSTDPLCQAAILKAVVLTDA